MTLLFIWRFLFSGPFEFASGIVGVANHIDFFSFALTPKHLRWISENQEWPFAALAETTTA